MIWLMPQPHNAGSAVCYGESLYDSSGTPSSARVHPSEYAFPSWRTNLLEEFSLQMLQS